MNNNQLENNRMSTEEQDAQAELERAQARVRAAQTKAEKKAEKKAEAAAATARQAAHGAATPTESTALEDRPLKRVPYVPGVTTIPRSSHDSPEQGTYVVAMSHGKRTALLSCPACGAMSYMDKHVIGAAGNVAEPVGCPKDCGYHEVGVTLSGWDA